MTTPRTRHFSLETPMTTPIRTRKELRRADEFRIMTWMTENKVVLETDPHSVTEIADLIKEQLDITISTAAPRPQIKRLADDANISLNLTHSRSKTPPVDPSELKDLRCLVTLLCDEVDALRTYLSSHFPGTPEASESFTQARQSLLARLAGTAGN